MHSRVTLLSLFATFIAAAVGQQCYAVDGTQLSNNTYAPCNPTAKHSGCCATKKSSGADICLDNGLCLSTQNEYVGMIWQSGCTDPTGKDPSCARMCPSANPNGGATSISAWNIQQCDYGQYCCRASTDRTSCCNTTAPKLTLSSVTAQLQVQTSTTTLSPTPDPTNVAATAVSTGTPFTTTALPDDACSAERHQTVVVGATIGSLFGAAIAGLLATVLWMAKRERRQRKLKEHYEEQFSQTAAYRKAIASSAVSLMGLESVDEAKGGSGGSGS